MIRYVAKTYRDYLDTKLDEDVRVSGDVPITPPARLVTVQTVPGGGVSPKPRILSWRRLVFQCWVSGFDPNVPDEITAGELCEAVRHHVVESVFAGIGTHRVAVVGEPGRFDDPTVASSRFQTTIDVLVPSYR